MKKKDKITAGRPFKMENWVAELQKVLAVEDIIFLSDKDLQFLVNQNLEESERITDRTFENWKAGKFHPDEEAEVINKIKIGMRYLTTKQRQVIQMTFGIDCEKETYEEIGKRLGVTKARVGQIRKKALEKLNDLLSSNNQL